MPIQIGINNAIKGGTGTGTGGGGGGAVFTDVFDVTTLAGETVSFYTVRQTEPAIVDWGDGSPTETINLSVLQTHTYPAGSYVISISGGAVELSFNARGGQSDLSKVTNVLSLSKLIFGESSSLYTCPVNVTYTATDTPGFVTGETSVEESARWFPTDADNYPNSIPNWQVGSVNYFESCFEKTIASPPSTLDVDVSSWVFKTGAVHYSSFQYLIDARIAECFVGWDASGATNVTLDNAFRPRLSIGGVDLDPATYPAAKAAYDNLINTKGWVDNGSVNWVAPTPPPAYVSGSVMHVVAADVNSYSGPGATTWNDISGNSSNVSLVNGPTEPVAGDDYIVFDGVDDYGVHTWQSGDYFYGDSSTNAMFPSASISFVVSFPEFGSTGYVWNPYAIAQFGSRKQSSGMRCFQMRAERRGILMGFAYGSAHFIQWPSNQPNDFQYNSGTGLYEPIPNRVIHFGIRWEKTPSTGYRNIGGYINGLPYVASGFTNNPPNQLANSSRCDFQFAGASALRRGQAQWLLQAQHNSSGNILANTLQGDLREVLLYTGALTDAEFLQNYNAYVSAYGPLN